MNLAKYSTGLQHIGIVVKDLQTTIDFYEGLGFHREWMTDDAYHVVFLRLANLVIEAYTSGEKRGLAGTVDHFALNVLDINAVFKAISASPKYRLMHKEIQQLPFFQNGVRFFTIFGPDSERVEFNEIIKCEEPIFIREKAMELLKKHNKGEYRLFHALSVESVMRYFAYKNHEDPEFWGAIGLLHDVDYEEYPGRHCEMNPEILSLAGYGPKFIHAVQSHGFGTTTDLVPELFMEKVLYTMNELVSLISESALSLPSRSIFDLDKSTVHRMFNREGFAKNANRDIILRGSAMLNLSLEDVIEQTILGMREAATELGLNGACVTHIN